MSLLIALLVGSGVGWLAAVLTERKESLLFSMVVGVVGAILGGAFFTLGSTGNEATMLFSWASLWWSVAGALIASFFMNLVTEHFENS